MKRRQSDYVIWAPEDVENACALDELTGVERVFELNKGVPRAAGFPDNVTFRMNPDFPNDTLLTDNLINTDLLIVASKRLKEFIETWQPRNIEYLPVTILNHKGKPASREYFIIHPTDPVECLEIDKCGAVWGKIAKDQVKEVKRLVIDESRIGPDRNLFRLKTFFRLVLVHRQMAEAIDREGFTGVRWIELSEYPED